MVYSSVSLNLERYQMSKLGHISNARGVSRSEYIREILGDVIAEYESKNGVIKV